MENAIGANSTCRNMVRKFLSAFAKKIIIVIWKFNKVPWLQAVWGIIGFELLAVVKRVKYSFRMKISFILSGSEWAQRCKGKKEKEKITGADTEKCNLNSEMTEQVETCCVATSAPDSWDSEGGGGAAMQVPGKLMAVQPATWSLNEIWSSLSSASFNALVRNSTKR